MSLWMLALGALCLLVVAYDAISTTLSFGAAAGPITSRIGAGWWKLSRRFAGRPDSPIIVSSGPVILLLTIGTWLLLLWAGWTLVFAAEPDAVISATSRTPADGWSRVYFAGFTAFTLGVGDYIPNGAPWEVLTSFATVSGLGLTTLAITYLVPVVSAVTARRVQANSIAGLGSDPCDLVANAYKNRDFQFLDHRLPQLADSILETAERHLSYPVLHYFHSSQRHVDLRVQVHVLDEAVTILQHGLDDSAAPHPAVLHGVRHAIRELVRRAETDPPEGPPPPPPDLRRLDGTEVKTVSTDRFAERVAALAEHRRRVAGFARESLWRLRDLEGR